MITVLQSGSSAVEDFPFTIFHFPFAIFHFTPGWTLLLIIIKSAVSNLPTETLRLLAQMKNDEW
ncbi:MAG: hypothetical protein QOF62_209 [Pyrinomonadaceae bacterium]|jgi:hypothetical protein|nr:hypothetical protein [Pyrinomonadaceae bacterium]